MVSMFKSKKGQVVTVTLGAMAFIGIAVGILILTGGIGIVVGAFIFIGKVVSTITAVPWYGWIVILFLLMMVLKKKKQQGFIRR